MVFAAAFSIDRRRALTFAVHNLTSATRPADPQGTFARADSRRYLVAAGSRRFLEEPYLWLCLALFYGAICGRRWPKLGSHTIEPVTADRPGAQSLRKAPAVVATPQAAMPGFVAKIAEAITKYGLPAFVVCLPLEFTAQIFKIQLARIVLLVVGVAFVYLLAVRRRTLVFPKSASGAVLAIYLLACLVSWLLTRAPGSTNAAGDVVAYSLLALLIINLARTETDHRMAWGALLVSAIGVALIVAFLHFTHLSIWRADPAGVRVNATFGDPDIAARFMTIAAGVGILMFAARERTSRMAAIAATAAAACAAFVSFTYSKSALLLFGFCVLFAAAFGIDRRRAAAIGAAILVVFVAAVALTPNTGVRIVRGVESIVAGGQNVVHPGPLVNQPQSTTDLDVVRIYLMRAGLQMFRDHPIAGVGFGGFQHALLTRYSSFLPTNPPATLSHSSAVTILSEQGLIGVVLILGFLVLLLREVIASIRADTPWRPWVVIPAVAIVPILLYSQFEGRLIEEPYLWLALGLLYSARSLEHPDRTLRVGA